MYHINLKGEVGECSAELACPFGDFEKDHFTTQEQALAAYEGSMKGKSVFSFKKKEAHFQVIAEQTKEIAKEKKKLRKRLEKLEKPKAKEPIKPLKGYLQSIKNISELHAGMELESAEKITRVSWSGSQNIAYYRKKGETLDDKPRKFTNEILEAGNFAVWRNAINPELQAVYQADLQEQKIENIVLNYTNIGLRGNLRRWTGSAGREYEGFIIRVRLLKKLGKELQNSGISYPYTRALEKAQTIPVKVFGDDSGSLGRETLNILIKGDVKPHFLSYAHEDNVKNFKKAFPEGEAPHFDFNIEEEWAARQELGLV